jgi:hypothetical protein
MTKHKRLSLASFLGIVLLIGLVLVLFHGGLPNLLTWVSPGWEIYDQMGGMRFPTATGSKVCTQASDFNAKEDDVTSVYWKVDIDNESYGVPTIMVQISDIKHVDFSGKELPYDQYVETRTVTRGNNTYYLDYHIYTFSLTIRTVADKLVSGGGIFTIPTVYHETSWPYTGQHGWPDGGGHLTGPEHGIEFTGGTYIKFVINPWRGVGERDAPNSSYTLQNCWAGVMNSYVLTKDQGTIANQWGTIPTPAPDAQYYVKGALDPGAQVPMFADDGSFGTPAPVVSWGAQVTPDLRIPSAVVLYLPVEMMPGGDPHYGGLAGACDDIYPIDVAIHYSVRVDVLQTHDFSLQTGKPPELTWPRDYFGWSEDFWTALLAGMNPFAFLGAFSPLAWFMVTLIAIAVVILILLAVFAPWVLPKIFGGLRQARDFTYESIEKRPRHKKSG